MEGMEGATCSTCRLQRYSVYGVGAWRTSSGVVEVIVVHSGRCPCLVLSQEDDYSTTLAGHGVGLLRGNPEP